MQFLYPSFLWALLAAAIPVIIHLFNFRRTKKVYFTNVAFLKAVNTTTSSFRRLKHLLIMAARILAIICLVLAFAQPILTPKSGNIAKSAGLTSIYIDNSLSMQNELNKKSYLSKAISKVEELLTAFPQGSRLQLLTNDFSAQEHSLANAQQIKERTTTIDYTHTPRTIENVLKRQGSLAAKHQSQGGNQFILFSDFQKSTSGVLNQIKVDTASTVFLVPVQAKAIQNVFVDSVWLNTPFIREMQVNTLTVKLSNTGERAVQNLPIKLFVDEVQIASAVANIDAHGVTTANFNFTVKDKGFKKGRISFDDTPVTFDNDYYFVLHAAPKIRVLHLFGQSAPEKFVQHVFENDSVFALRSISASNVDVGQIRTADLVVLEGVQLIDGSLSASVQEFIKAGGSVMLIPPTAPDIANYNAFLGKYGIRNIQLKSSSPTESSILAEPSKSDGFFGDIFDSSNLRAMLQMPSQSANLTWQVAGQKLLQFRNGMPYLSSTKVGQAEIYLLASPLSKEWGDFARNALFVPIMYKIGALSVRQEPSAYSFKDNTFTIDVENANANTNFKLRKGKLELIPVQQLNGKQLTIELPKANQLNEGQSIESGYYELLNNGKVERILAFNHDHSESQMDFYSSQELKSIFGGQKNIQVFDQIDDTDFVKTFKEQNFGKALWRYFLIGALVCLAIEILLVRFLK
ncbi:MAG: BatA domain-containing protein [Flectobacillus sp.]|uniref:BatA domain-containing protein n=1 Tax=Flectobacillus sp. TaxID=50419 RepID=UPI003B9D7DE0